MIKKILVPVVSGLFLLITAQSALAKNADHANAQIPMAIQKLATQGYVDVREISFDKGVYKVEAINKDGQETKLKMNAKDFDIINIKVEKDHDVKPNSAKIKMVDAIKSVETAGYHDVFNVEQKDGNYELHAFAKDNKKTELKVNSETGVVTVDKDFF